MHPTMYSLRYTSSPHHFLPRELRRALRVFDEHPFFRSSGPFTVTAAAQPRATSTTTHGTINASTNNKNSRPASSTQAVSSSPTQSYPPNPFEVFDAFFGPSSRRSRDAFGRFGSSWPFSSPFFSDSPDFFNDRISSLFNSNSFPFPSAPDAAQNSAWAPAVEIQTHADRYTVRAQVPGAKKEDLRIELISDGQGRQQGGEAAELVISGKVEIEADKDNISKEQEGSEVGATQAASAEGWSIVNPPPSSPSSSSSDPDVTPTPSSPSPPSSSTVTTTPLVPEANNNNAEQTTEASSGAQTEPPSEAKQVGGQQPQQQAPSETGGSEPWGSWGFFRGEFSRSLRFPAPINVEGIKAKYENGLLTIEVPKREPDPPKEAKTITIE